jgi:NitT/TauT family transport system substrate-binding protein
MLDSIVKFTRRRAALALLCGLSVLALSGPVAAAEAKQKFKVAWTIYVGWVPWDYGETSGIIKKWADKYGIEIEVVQLNDYVESINQYTAGAFDGCVMTNMDALTIPAAGGVDSTALIVGSFSNGNDGIVLKGKSDLAAIKGQSVNLVELSVSHYLLARALGGIGLSEKDIKVVNTSDADIVSAAASDDVTALVTWNPQLAEIAKMPDANIVYDSAKTPGEIMDLMVVNTETLAANPAFGKAMAGAWYEIMSVMTKNDETGLAVRTALGKVSGTDLAGYDSQLKTTRLFSSAADAVAFTQSADVQKTMKSVAKFSFEHGLLGEGASSEDFIGIGYPGGAVTGDKGNVKFRFDDTYMKMAAEQKL